MMRWGWRALGTLLAAGLLAADAGAATAAPRPGVEAGVSLAGFTWDSDQVPGPGSGFRPAWWARATLEIPLAARWALATGVGYGEVGEVDSGQIGGTGSALTFTIHTAVGYLTLPATVRWRSAATPHAFLELGPEVGYLARAFQELEVRDLGAPSPMAPARSSGRSAAPAAQIFEELSNLDARDRYHPWNVALVAGLGWEFPVRGHAATLGLRYAEGLTDILRSDVVRRRTRAIRLGAGWRW